MKTTRVIKMKRVSGWLIRLTCFSKKYYVNSYAPRGKLYSFRFNTMNEAERFFVRYAALLRSTKK